MSSKAGVTLDLVAIDAGYENSVQLNDQASDHSDVINMFNKAIEVSRKGEG